MIDIVFTRLQRWYPKLMQGMCRHESVSTNGM